MSAVLHDELKQKIDHFAATSECEFPPVGRYLQLPKLTGTWKSLLLYFDPFLRFQPLVAFTYMYAILMLFLHELRIAAKDNKLRETRMRWFGHISRRPDTTPMCRVERL